MRVQVSPGPHYITLWAWGTSATDIAPTTAIAVPCPLSLTQEASYFIHIEHGRWGWCLRVYLVTSNLCILSSHSPAGGGRGTKGTKG